MKKPLSLLAGLAFSTFLYAADEIKPNEAVNITLLAEITPQGQKINGLALEYPENVLSGSDLRQLYQVQTSLDNAEKESRSVLKAYVNAEPKTTALPQAGKFVIVELDTADKNAATYSVKDANKAPMKFKSKDENGNIVETEKVQAVKIPEFFANRLSYSVEQKGLLKLTNGTTLGKTEWTQTAEPDKIKTPYLDDFVAKQVNLDKPENKLNYRLYSPLQKNGEKYPLVIFLHGSGQVGSDNLAHLISSKGAIATLPYEPSFVLAPQYDQVFDPFDNAGKGQKGGIHWQTDNRINLVFKMIDETIKANPQIDINRIYVNGLSRGAEGGLNLLLARPNFFAGALLMSGREAYTNEWVDGNATKENLAAIKDLPIWFFHSKEDKVSPVKGSRINYQILHEQLNAPNVKYTEFSFEQAGDNGIVNNNPHNTWDAVYNSPEVIEWLLQQKRP
ncbi:alpha/beta hydrolase-fold protein [Mannheimia pernigra]|uniref:carboxylesterase family protein n=1 Tax=Mannheimia pernigra TaxID=111844 RepID=UPI0013171A87|nr:alpha/beta hydrolase-fold protein [Mannheimia pernigra]QHB17025.1 phospholipase [Mannheimia pernigra]